MTEPCQSVAGFSLYETRLQHCNVGDDLSWLFHYYRHDVFNLEIRNRTTHDDVIEKKRIPYGVKIDLFYELMMDKIRL